MVVSLDTLQRLEMRLHTQVWSQTSCGLVQEKKMASNRAVLKVILLLMIMPTRSSARRCEAIIGRDCIRYIKKSTSWDNAERFCKAAGYGHLASIQDMAEVALIQKLADDQSLWAVKTVDAWIGLKVTGKDGHTWSDGTPVKTEVYNTMPRNLGVYGSKCFMVTSDIGAKEVDCEGKNKFFCRGGLTEVQFLKMPSFANMGSGGNYDRYSVKSTIQCAVRCAMLKWCVHFSVTRDGVGLYVCEHFEDYRERPEPATHTETYGKDTIIDLETFISSLGNQQQLGGG